MKWIIIIFLIMPFLFTYILNWVLRKIGLSKNKSLSFAADCTTPFLLFSLPVIFKAIWGFSITVIFYAVLIFIAIIFTYIDWRSKKEIHIVPLLKRIWRFYFLFFIFLYVIFMIVGFIYWIIEYMMN